MTGYSYFQTIKRLLTTPVVLSDMMVYELTIINDIREDFRSRSG